MPTRPLVSVVTPTLNQATFLESTLGSVRAQTYPHVEHVVVDGGSTDGTVDILRRADARAEFRWLSEPDGGMYDAVNKGLGLARGDVLAYLNSDDAWLPWAVESVMRVFEARPEVDLVYGDGTKVEHETGVQRLRLFPPFDAASLANYESLMQPAVFFRRRLFDQLAGFDASMRYVADLDFWLRAAAAGATIAHVDEVIAIERLHGGRLSAASREAMAAEDAAMRARHCGTDGGPEARERAKTRDLAWQRRLLRRFVWASVLRRVPVPLSTPWSRFLREGRTRVRWRRVLEASVPHKHKLLRNAVVSRLVADVLQAAGRDEELPPPRKPTPTGIRRLTRPFRRAGRRGLKVLRALPRSARTLLARLALVPEPIATYRYQLRKGRLAGVPSVGRGQLVRDFLPWLRTRRHSTLADGRPWLTFEATRLLERRSLTGAKVFEFGSGGSTLYLARRAAQVVSVEHDPAWFPRVRQALGDRENVEVLLVEPRPAVDDRELAVGSTGEGYEGLTFIDYTRVAARYPDHHFDVLIVDGRARTAAFFEAEPKVAVGGTIVLDDSERPRYGEVLQAARRAGWVEHGRYGPKPFSPTFARTTVWTKTGDLEPRNGT